MRGERVTPKLPDDVRLTMTVDEAQRLQCILLWWYEGGGCRDTAKAPLAPGNLVYDVRRAIDEALA